MEPNQGLNQRSEIRNQEANRNPPSWELWMKIFDANTDIPRTYDNIIHSSSA
jgi:hypothetical protein